MRKFQFSLERMLRFREQLLEREKNALNQILAQLHALEAEMQLVTSQLAELRTQWDEKVLIGVNAQELHSFQFHEESGRKHLEGLNNRRIMIQAKMEAQRQLVVKASQEVSKLEKLRDRQLEEYQYAVLKADEAFIAEQLVMKLAREMNEPE